MVQSELHHLDLKPLSRNANGAVRPQLLHESVNQTKVCPTTNKGSLNGKSHVVKLNPLHVTTQNKDAVFTEKKCQHRLNVVPLNPRDRATGSKNKGLPSKIPILQKPLINVNRKNDAAQCDTTLSAADKRQKFHQSRLRVAPSCSTTTSSFHFNYNKLIPYDLIPWYDANKINAIHHQFPVPLGQSQKLVLPPVKDSVPAAGNEFSSSQGKKKNLLGEITHFPALCNVSTSKIVKKSNVSSVPNLPPIHPPPAAPPPSISSSLEQNLKPDESVGDVKNLQDRNTSKPVIFQMLIPVGLR